MKIELMLEDFKLPPLSLYLEDKDLGKAESFLIKANLAGRIIAPSELNENFIAGFFANCLDTNLRIVFDRMGVDRKIRFLVVETDAIQAVAGPCDEWFLIAMSFRLLFEIQYRTFHLTKTASFNSLLDGSEFPNFALNANVGRKEALQALLEIEPAHELTDTSFTISLIAQMFIAFHEAGHIINGHVGLLNSGEIAIENKSDDYMITSRTLEFDADCFATDRVFTFIRETQVFFEKHPISRVLNTPERVISFAAAGIHVAILTLQANSSRSLSVLDYSKDTHPPSTIRYLNALAQGRLMIDRMYGDEKSIKDAPQDHAIRGAAAIEFALSELTGLQFDAATLDDWAVASIAYNEQVLRRWAELRPNLSRYKIRSGELPLPQY